MTSLGKRQLNNFFSLFLDKDILSSWNSVENMLFKKLMFKILLVLLSASYSVSAYCRDSWKPFEGKCYKYFPLKKSWTEARSYCQKQGKSVRLLNLNDPTIFGFNS